MFTVSDSMFVIQSTKYTAFIKFTNIQSATINNHDTFEKQHKIYTTLTQFQF